MKACSNASSKTRAKPAIKQRAPSAGSHQELLTQQTSNPLHFKLATRHVIKRSHAGTANLKYSSPQEQGITPRTANSTIISAN